MYDLIDVDITQKINQVYSRSSPWGWAGGNTTHYPKSAKKSILAQKWDKKVCKGVNEIK